MNRTLLRLVLVAAAGLVGGPAVATDPIAPPLVCQAGQAACSGEFGHQCYSPSRGENCNRGQVCSIGQNACLGRYGAGCYSPSRGESCTQGLICSIGQSVCAKGGYAQCYSPSRGERCN